MKTAVIRTLLGLCVLGAGVPLRAHETSDASVEMLEVCAPNPTTNQTLLRWETEIDRIEVISESGQRVRTFNVSGLQQKIVDMSHMPTGVYFVRFLVDNSIVATKKLIKQ